jgi:sugar lactone lactonase YvrE
MKKYSKFLTLLISLSISPIYAQYNISTYAGIGTIGYAGDGGLATAAKMDYPHKVVVDKNGNVFIADYNNEVIRRVAVNTGIITTYAGTGSSGFSGDGGLATAAKLSSPRGIAIDTLGNLYIADYQNSRVRKVNSSGVISTIAGIGTATYSGDGGPATLAGLVNPGSIDLDDAGNIYIADRDGNRIRKITASTGIITTIAGNGTMATSGDGGLATAASVFYPRFVYVDYIGNVYIVDQYENIIRKIDFATGIINTIAGQLSQAGYTGDGGLATAAKLNQPDGLFVDNTGTIYFADAGNSRIRKIDGVSGIISTIAGVGTGTASGDGGSALLAGFTPTGVDVDKNGNIYIADYFNFRVRKLTPITTALSTIIPNETHLNIYPNPSTGIFNLVLDKNIQKGTLKITNLLGEQVYNEELYAANKTTVNLSHLTNGIYLVQISDGKSVQTQKLIIQH